MTKPIYEWVDNNDPMQPGWEAQGHHFASLTVMQIEREYVANCWVTEWSRDSGPDTYSVLEESFRTVDAAQCWAQAQDLAKTAEDYLWEAAMADLGDLGEGVER